MMLRRLLNLLALLSLLLCLAAATMWVRSYRAWDRGFVCGDVAGDVQRTVDVSSALGELSVAIERADGFLSAPGRARSTRLYRGHHPGSTTAHAPGI